MIIIPLLDDAEAISFAAESLRVHGLRLPANEVIAKLTPAVRSNPAALLAVLARLEDVDFSLWPVPSATIDEPQRAIEDILDAIPADAREALALLLPMSGVRFGAATELLGIRERLLRGLALLLDRALVTRGQDMYVVPSIVAAALRHRDEELADRVVDDLIGTCLRALQSIGDGATELLAFGEVVAAVASYCRSLARWSACARLASNDMLQTLYAVGLWKEYTVVLRTGMEAAEALGSPVRVFLACQLSRKLLDLGEREAGRAILDRIDDRTVAPGSPNEACLISHRALFRERYEDQLADIARSIELHDTLGRAQDAAIGWKIIGNLQLSHGDWEAARRSYEKALQKFDGNAGRHAIDIEARLATCDLQEGNLDSAESRARRALQECERLRFRAGRRPLLLTLALITEKRGDYAHAAKLAKDAAAEPFGHPGIAAFARATAERIAARQGGAL